MSNFNCRKQHVYNLEQKVVLVLIAYFAIHDNCEEGEFFLQLIHLNYIKPA